MGLAKGVPRICLSGCSRIDLRPIEETQTVPANSLSFMKILYVGSERNDAQAVAAALRGIDQAVSVSRVAHLEHAVRWLDEHRDITALVVESAVDAGSGPSVLAPLRGLAWHPAVVVIVPDGTKLPVDPQPGAHCYIQKNQSLFRDLPVVVTRAIERAARVDLEQQLARATAALQEAERRHKTAVAATDRQLAELHSQYEIGMARAAATWDMVDEQLRTAALEVERANQDRASAAADVDRLSLQLTEADAVVEAANARAEQERLAASESVRRATARARGADCTVRPIGGAASKTGSKKPSAHWTMRRSGTRRR